MATRSDQQIALGRRPANVFAGCGWWQAVTAEFLQLAPATLASWMIINLPFLAHRRRLGDAQDPIVAAVAGQTIREDE